MGTTSDVRGNYSAWQECAKAKVQHLLLLRRRRNCFLALAADSEGRLQIYFHIVGLRSIAYVEKTALVPMTGGLLSGKSASDRQTCGFVSFAPIQRYSNCSEINACLYRDGTSLAPGVNYSVAVSIRSNASRYRFTGVIRYRREEGTRKKGSSTIDN